MAEKPNLADMLFEQRIIETQDSANRGEILEVVFAGQSTTQPNLINFRVRYRLLRSEQELWTTYQIEMPSVGQKVVKS